MQFSFLHVRNKIFRGISYLRTESELQNRLIITPLLYVSTSTVSQSIRKKSNAEDYLNIYFAVSQQHRLWGLRSTRGLLKIV